jgi:hypothetical protein
LNGLKKKRKDLKRFKKKLRSKKRSVVGTTSTTTIIGGLEISIAGSSGSSEIGDIVGNTTENGCDGGYDGNRGYGNGGAVDITV